LNIETLRTQARDGGRDDLGILPADRAAIARVRVEAHHGDALMGNTGTLHCLNGKCGRSDDPLFGNERRDILQRHVRRHARRPQFVQLVQFGKEAADARERRVRTLAMISGPTPAGSPSNKPMRADAIRATFRSGQPAGRAAATRN